RFHSSQSIFPGREISARKHSRIQKVMRFNGMRSDNMPLMHEVIIAAQDAIRNLGKHLISPFHNRRRQK
ncbi:hypothetical protein KC953_01500, partial [Candidatus Saccharibacteria bacterium]|nr:hypothetical protein [Candidatus Saccharibacteria bacterium]